MNQFDIQQIEFLKPLVKDKNNPVILHFSFFANTFPIAYHYNLLLEMEGISQKRIRELLKLHDWNDFFPSESNPDIYTLQTKIIKDKNKWDLPKSINIFYTSNINYKTPNIQRSNPFKIISDKIKIFKKDEAIEHFNFSNYCPRFIFLNNNLYTQYFLDYEKGQFKNVSSNGSLTLDSIEFCDLELLKDCHLQLSDILNKAKIDGIEYLCIYTDTIYEAKDIMEEYDWDQKNIFYFDKTNIASLKLQDKYKNESKKMDIYLYGAPTSFHLYKLTEKYIPILLDPDKQTSGISAKACLHYNIHQHSSEISDIKNALENYHNNFFTTAISKRGVEMLNNARNAYNKYSKLIRHDSYFYTPESFRNCIKLHHKHEKDIGLLCKTPLTNNNNDAPTQKNIHVHYGAGKLGIGLVLPLIKPNKECENQLIVIQKNRDEWIKKIRTDLNEIKLSNGTWSHTFNLKRISSNSFDVQLNTDCFYLFDELKHTEEILKLATSISYSLNNQDVEKEFLNFISEIELKRNVLIFPFENKPFGTKDEKGKAALAKLISEKPNLKNYTRLKADRICLERSFDLDNRINVVCEEHIEVVINIDESATKNLFDISKDRKREIIFTKDSKRYQFLSDRKEYLVNELHFILAVYGYDFLLTKGILHWENQFITIIQSALTSEPRYKIPIETFIRLQIIRLLNSDNYDVSVIQNEYRLEEQNVELIYEHLLKYAKAVTLRFNSSKEDQISRVFNTNDANAIERKFHSIIEVIENFITEKRAAIESIPLISAGTFLEYRELIKDIKNRIENIFHSRITNFHVEVSSKKKEQIQKQLELEIFDSKIKSLTRKNENILVVFDVDGTIFKAKEIFLPAIKQVLSENAIQGYSEDELLKFVGMPYKEFEDWQQQLTIKTTYKEFTTRLQELELKNIISDGELYKGVIELFTILKEAKYSLAICTNARKEYLETIFNKFNLFNFFSEDNILYPEKFSVHTDKQYMLSYIKQITKPFKCYMIGDRFYDSEAAQKNGFTFIGVNYGYGYEEIKYRADFLIREIEDITKIISDK